MSREQGSYAQAMNAYSPPKLVDHSSDRPLHKQLAHLIRVQIQTGELAPGQRLLAQKDYAQGHGLSRDTVERAMNTLCHLVDKSRHHDGTWTLTYAVHDKNKARAHILQKHGTDRQKWPITRAGPARATNTETGRISKMQPHTHGPDGEMILVEPSPEALETEAVEEVADAAVEVAKVEADHDIAIAREDTKRAQVIANEELAELRGEVRALRETVEKLSPPEPAKEVAPTPEPVIIEAPPVEEETVPAPEPQETEPPKEKKSRGFFGPAY